ncbi:MULTISPECIES: CsbD family protein [Donghicola]|jgi:uncharacterized protein YjbJ (UPF0337 family)|uniref:CsbD-like domain-containing protein n=1 Tax=Donghicola eburneus TaxID=393278 RepID=A0A1M4MUX8_9RHOB|nr:MULTISPECIES: CsbD family protein [Donghicola]MCT4579153.1 CsbD family protein [Donghicola sp.]SCM65982.1 hypothetical protein KARMA_0153 [Donghicola eburneus]SFQ55950.1 Uncharacterized conserved protein YjbJ, UPF0337 family [Donghicola eburneus]
MNWDIVEGKWDQFKGSAKEKWGDMTDDDVTEMEGKRDKVVGKLQEKYGWTKEKAEQEADAFLSENA